MKTGYKTTEFWLTLIAMLVGMLIAAGTLSDDEGALVIEAAGILVAAIASGSYAISRGIAKSS